MGSVKDLKVVKKPSKNGLGTGRFIFSDRYSVFDWGEMPDHIAHKGEAIALLGAYFFEELERKNVSTHYIGLVEEGEVKSIQDIKKPVNAMEIKLLQVIEPTSNGGYDYSRYLKEKEGALIPLEIIYRNSLPEGSSVFKRLRKGELKPEDIGLDKFPAPGQTLDPPILDFSTKLEITDRYLSKNEARKISGLSDEELEEIRDITMDVNRLISREFSRVGLTNEDGKVEFGQDTDGKLILVDVVGTLDECRFTYQGLPVSKEIARIYYRNTEWYGAVEKAQRHGVEWKEMCPAPPPLPQGLKVAISELYRACTNEITGKNWFDAPPLKDVLKEVKGKL